MNQKPAKGWLKHADFILIDLICLQLCYAITYWCISGWGNPYHVFSYRYLAIVLIFGQLIAIVFFFFFYGIIRRGRLTTISRLQLSVTLVLYIVVDYAARMMNGRLIRMIRASKGERGGRSVVLITSGALADESMRKLTTSEYGLPQDYFISGIALLDGDVDSVKGNYDIPVGAFTENTINRIRGGWVDEVFILQPTDMPLDRKLFDDLADMGITIHFTLALLNDDDWPPLQMRKLGSYKVLTSSINYMTYNQALIKRLMDIVGGLVGCLITGILFIFVAPAIYIKSPGPIFFKQDRIGLNGKVFKMYKFRSMYMDAEERKAALMEQNKLGTDLFFKMDDDPRIIGSEKKDKNGKPKGIGNFIRNTSIDEFPQFINVILGQMSLVGTRPPLLSEFKAYELHHRARMAIKPGITGMWQISGRSEITDFEEIVKLDREYIENWSIGLDIKILLKTVLVVIKRKGAE